jgi:hypothetical protein
MLKKGSTAVRLYLERAATAQERASAAVDETTRQFHRAMESKWMDLAASTAVVERVDLFLQTRDFRLRLSPSDLCPNCHQRMSLTVVQTTAELEEHTFQCPTCRCEHTRCSGVDDYRICGGRSINLTRIELDAIIRALQFEADAMTAEAAQFRGKRPSSPLAIAEANRLLIAILKAEWDEV